MHLVSLQILSSDFCIFCGFAQCEGLEIQRDDTLKKTEMSSKREETVISLNTSNSNDSDSDIDDLFADHSKTDKIPSAPLSPSDSDPIHSRKLPPNPVMGVNGTSGSNESVVGVQVIAGPSTSNSNEFNGMAGSPMNDTVGLMPETELSQTQKVLVSAAAKYAVTGGFSVLFLVMQFFVTAIYDLMEREILEMELVLDIWFMTALFVVFWTIYISFPTVTGKYECCCRGLHNLTERKFRRQMITEIEYKDVTVLDMSQINSLQS